MSWYNASAIFKLLGEALRRLFILETEFGSCGNVIAFDEGAMGGLLKSLIGRASGVIISSSESCASKEVSYAEDNAINFEIDKAVQTFSVFILCRGGSSCDSSLEKISAVAEAV